MVVRRALGELRRQAADALRNRTLDIVILSCYLAALTLIYWQQRASDRDLARENRAALMCTNAAIALIMDARIRLDFAADPKLGEATKAEYDRLKQLLLTPRFCPAIERLQQGG